MTRLVLLLSAVVGLVIFRGEPVSVPLAVTFDEAVRLHFADVVAELGKGVVAGFEAECGEDGLVNLAVRQPPILVPLWRRTSIRRMMRVSWILMPGTRLRLR